MIDECLFCRIVAGAEPAAVVRRTSMTVTFVPLNPVVEGHLLVTPTTHVEDFTTKPSVSAFVMHQAANIAQDMGPCNLITSKGREATQSVFHLHVHLVPRRAGDGLALPWSGQMTSPTEDVYEAAARTYDEAVNADLRNPPGSALGDDGRRRLIESRPFRALIDSAYAAGRAQAAADIRAAWDTRDGTDWLAGASWAAKIAGGEPRG